MKEIKDSFNLDLVNPSDGVQLTFTEHQILKLQMFILMQQEALKEAAKTWDDLSKSEDFKDKDLAKSNSNWYEETYNTIENIRFYIGMPITEKE